jgi:NAD(P)-dependent dehydrogenase (short-subunit alcohol dehydrogenase family)
MTDKSALIAGRSPGLGLLTAVSLAQGGMAIAGMR